MIQRFLATKQSLICCKHGWRWKGNFSNEKFMEEVAGYECFYHRNSKDFKDKNKKVNCWEKIGEKFNLSAAEAGVKFRNIRTAYGRYLKRLKTLPSGSGRDALPREFQNRLTKRKNKFACSKISSSTTAILFAAIFPPAKRACNFDTSAVRNVCNSRFCDRLRSSAIIWKQLSFRSSAICDLRSAIVCDRLRSYGTQPLAFCNYLFTIWRTRTKFRKIASQQHLTDKMIVCLLSIVCFLFLCHFEWRKKTSDC